VRSHGVWEVCSAELMSLAASKSRADTHFLAIEERRRGFLKLLNGEQRRPGVIKKRECQRVVGRWFFPLLDSGPIKKMSN